MGICIYGWMERPTFCGGTVVRLLRWLDTSDWSISSPEVRRLLTIWNCQLAIPRHPPLVQPLAWAELQGFMITAFGDWRNVCSFVRLYGGAPSHLNCDNMSRCHGRLAIWPTGGRPGGSAASLRVNIHSFYIKHCVSLTCSFSCVLFKPMLNWKDTQRRLKFYFSFNILFLFFQIDCLLDNCTT